MLTPACAHFCREYRHPMCPHLQKTLSPHVLRSTGDIITLYAQVFRGRRHPVCLGLCAQVCKEHCHPYVPSSVRDTVTPCPVLSAHLVPVYFLHIHQDPHELRDGKGWVGVIQLNGNLQFTQGNAFNCLVPMAVVCVGGSCGRYAHPGHPLLRSLVYGADSREQTPPHRH